MTAGQVITPHTGADRPSVPAPPPTAAGEDPGPKACAGPPTPDRALRPADPVLAQLLSLSSKPIRSPLRPAVPGRPRPRHHTSLGDRVRQSTLNEASESQIDSSGISVSQPAASVPSARRSSPARARTTSLTTPWYALSVRHGQQRQLDRPRSEGAQRVSGYRHQAGAKITVRNLKG